MCLLGMRRVRLVVLPRLSRRRLKRGGFDRFGGRADEVRGNDQCRERRTEQCCRIRDPARRQRVDVPTRRRGEGLFQQQIAQRRGIRSDQEQRCQAILERRAVVRQVNGLMSGEPAASNAERAADHCDDDRSDSGPKRHGENHRLAANRQHQEQCRSHREGGTSQVNGILQGEQVQPAAQGAEPFFDLRDSHAERRHRIRTEAAAAKIEEGD